MIELGNKIQRLRKERGLTQEQLASALSISPQAVSKWETGGGYPDMSMIPILANFFDVTLDELFEFDITKKAQKIEDVLTEAGNCFWNDFEKAEQLYLHAIKEFPSSEKLKTELLSLYECHIRAYGKNELFPRAEDLAKRLIVELTDIFAVCSVKNDLASLYMMNGEYAEAKALVESLPYMYPYMLNDRMRCAAYMLNGNDRLWGASEWKIIETQELFVACAQEGEGYFEIGEYDKSLASFKESTDVIERFMIRGKSGCDAYPIGGTDANHMCYYLGIAGCYVKLDHTNECSKAIEKATDIFVTSIQDRRPSDRKMFLETFKKAYARYGLADYVSFRDWHEQNDIAGYVTET